MRCIEGEIKAGHVKALAEDVKAADASKGQLITDRRVASTARQHAAGLEMVEVMTFDELIDATARFEMKHCYRTLTVRLGHAQTL